MRCGFNFCLAWIYLLTELRITDEDEYNVDVILVDELLVDDGDGGVNRAEVLKVSLSNIPEKKLSQQKVVLRRKSPKVE